MFSSYIKNLNDMVFSTSEGPEEQQSPGVLGRIGSWFSPWKGRSPKSPTESDQDPKLEGQEGSEDSGRGQKGEKPDLQGLSRDIFPSEGVDATQSAHRDGAVVCSTETEAGGGPREEESAGRREKRTGQGEGREESGNGAPESGNPARNASHLTHLSSPEQGVVWDCGRAHTEPRAQGRAQAQTGRKLHVYLEETSVTQCGQDAAAGQEVVRTKFTKSLEVVPKVKSSQSPDSQKSSTSTEDNRTNVKPVAGTQSYYSALAGVSLKSRKDTELESDQQTEGDSMGRKNSARRRIRKTSQGDGGTSPQEKTPPSSQPPPGQSPTAETPVTSPKGKSSKSQMGESSENSSSSSRDNPSSPASPEGGQSETSCPGTLKQLDDIQDSNSVNANTLPRAADGAAAMEDDNDSLYRVERKTETPESKRRSLKVSRSEVKFFPKHVPLNPKQSPAGSSTESKSTLRISKHEAKETKAESRVRDLKKIDEEPKPVAGRIAGKVSLFERPAGAAFNKDSIQTPRSADVSPVRIATEKLKAQFESSEQQRSRSAERLASARSDSASPSREKATTIKERARNFTEASKAGDKAALSRRPAMTGMSKKSTVSLVVASKSVKLDNQGKLDTKEQMPVETTKPDRRDTAGTGEKTSTSPDTTTKDSVVGKTKELPLKPDSVETDVPAKGPGDTEELTGDTKGPSRTGSRSKRRKSKEPLSPSSESKPESKPEVSAVKQQQEGDTKETLSAPKQQAGKVSSGSDKAQRSDKQPCVDDKQTSKESESSLKKENTEKTIKRQEGLPEPSVNADEPDTAARSSGTKTSIDKGPGDLPRKEEKAGEQSFSLTQQKDPKGRQETSPSSPSPAAPQPEGKMETTEKKTPVDRPKLDVKSSSEEKSQGKVSVAKKKDTEETQKLENKTPEIVKEAKDAGKVEKVDKTSPPEKKKEKEEPQPELLCSDKTTTKAEVSGGGKGISGTGGSVARDDKRRTSERKEDTEPGKDKAKPAAKQPEPAAEKKGSDHSVQTPTTTSPQNASEASVRTNEAVIMRDEGPSQKKTADVVVFESQTKESPAAAPEPAEKPQPNSVSVEKAENSPDDSRSHGANDAGLSGAGPVTKAAKAPVPVEEVTVTAANDTPALITAQADNAAEEASSVKEPKSPIPASTSVSAEREEGKTGSLVKTQPSEVKISGEIMKPTPGHPQHEEPQNKKSESDSTRVKSEEKKAHMPSDGTASDSTGDVVKKTAEKTQPQPPPKIELPPVANGDISQQAQIHSGKKAPVGDKPNQTPKAAASPEGNKKTPDSIQRSTMKKLHLPRGLSKDDSVSQQDAPSSWLDVDFPKQRLKLPPPKLTSSGSESNLLDTSGDLDDEDFIEKIKKLCAPFSLPPRKHNVLRQPQPPFALPAIKEDRFEKPFDLEEFKFGLRKNKKFTTDTTLSQLSKLQNEETKPSIKPARASLADRSLLLSSLDTHSRLREKTPVNEEDQKEEKEELIKVKSRLEGSCVLSRLSSSNFRSKRNGVDSQGSESSDSGEGSPTETPQKSPPPLSQPPPPSPTSTAPPKDPPAMQNSALSTREEGGRAAESVVSDSGLPLPSFNDNKLPDYFKKYLPREPEKPVPSKQGQEQVRTEVDGKMAAPAPGGPEADLAPNAGPLPPRIPGITPATRPLVPELKKTPRAQPQIRTPKGFHRRPGKMVVFEEAQFNGKAYEIFRDVTDATAMQLSPLISVKVVRGCWVLYEKPDFQGRTIALEEGGIELANVWAEMEPGQEPGPGLGPEGAEPQSSSPPMQIGSIRLAVWDYSIPRIDLFTEPEGHGRVTPYQDDAIETGSFGIPLSTASIQVHSGVWLVFSDPGFQGMVAVLETGVYPFPETWGFASPFVGSLRPLKMGGFKVENPSDVKAVVYEKPGFEGSSLETDTEVYSFCESEEDENDKAPEEANLQSKLKSGASLRVIGGLWVGYTLPGFEGQQFILEEGEYLDCSEWGGSEPLQSLRPVLGEFMSPHVKMFSDRDFGELGVNIDLTVPVINMEATGYGLKTQSVDVISGVWVVFEEPGFCGESYILEKGLYGCPEDWGALQPRVASVMPVALDDFQNGTKFKVQLFSEQGFQGTVLTLEDGVASLQDGYTVASCKVLSGSWMGFEGKDFTGRMYVLEAGSYPDLRAMGCSNANASIQSLQTAGFEFSLPSITLFERAGLRGKRVVLTDGSVNLQLATGCTRVQSVLVEGGIWVLYEEINYRGAQVLLRPGEVPDWHNLCSWRKIGSLRPLMQRQVHFRIRNRQTGLMMSVTGDLEEIKLLRIQETEETDGLEQIWSYQNGHLHCKLLEECCLCPSGSVTMAGSRVGLSPELNNHLHLWSINPDGFIRYSPTPDLVLEVKGGKNYDKTQVILNKLDPHKLNQRWDVEIL